MDTKRSEIENSIKTGFKTEVDAILARIDDMNDLSEAPKLSTELFNKAEAYISMIQNIELILRNFEKQIYQLKMHIYKDNNEGRSKMDATISLHSRGFYAQQLYTSPT